MNRWIKLQKKRRKRGLNRIHNRGVKRAWGRTNSPYFLAKTARRRAKNKVARASRRRNRG